MLHPYSRRQFLQTSSLLVAGAMVTSSFISKKYQPNLSFSSLGCPDWTFTQIVDFAAQHGYTGLELRGILREMDLTKVKEFATEQSRKETLQLMKDKGLRFVDLGSSATLHFAEGPERVKNLDEGKRFIDLAQQLDCPFVRAFPNIIPKGQDKAATIDLITKGLLELAEHAKGSKVSILLESHGDLVKISDLELVMKTARHPNAGLIWDVVNMWSITREAPAEAYKVLKPYIRHTHIKDAKVFAGAEPKYVLLGQGNVPIFEAIGALAKGGYQGYYSFEWEKLWHPELGDPALALADYAKVMKAHFA
ncbi:sugar phosphate isomerase/epimerase family protein [Mucilaginibacter gilvus]|uniref:Sugar phosphate isomerase/epimerase n=1 Tax=Mucilaginibacter gilvus TaxID=2305909 RepID=A0A3S4YKY2_9SPHI|nr:sugar phosphate isomerase/epimerase family protein [Mucilaginibacter gilvus]RWY57437.1 sugar phosphate isomerase/epimerase [Mucilaginibacter gilvus]